MTPSIRRPRNAVVDRQWPRRRLLAGLFALGFAFPSVAQPYTLNQLLRLPLERLLQLEFAARGTSRAGADCVPDHVCRIGAEGPRHVA